MFLLLTQQAEEGVTCVLSGTDGSTQEVEDVNWIRARKMLGDVSLRALSGGGGGGGGVRLCDLPDKHVRTKKNVKVCVCFFFPTMIRCEYFYLAETVVPCFKTPFLSPGGNFLLYNCRRIFLYYHFSLVISYHSVWLGLELFGLVHVQVHTLSAVRARARMIGQSQMS